MEDTTVEEDGPHPDDRVVLVHTTEASDERAAALARVLVEEGLVACASRTAVVSVYRWKGETCEESEVAMTLKTTRARLGALERRLLALHSYECPEFVVVECIHTERRYGDWVVSGANVPVSE